MYHTAYKWKSALKSSTVPSLSKVPKNIPGAINKGDKKSILVDILAYWFSQNRYYSIFLVNCLLMPSHGTRKTDKQKDGCKNHVHFHDIRYFIHLANLKAKTEHAY